jgi:DNA-binding SARP family transcriptional activator
MAEALQRLQLRCFGPPTALVDGHEPPSDVLWRKHVALLVYLALSPDRMRSREHLLGLLWPEKTQEKARHSLNEALRRLRSGLGTDRIVTNGDVVQLSDQNLGVDVLEFEQHAVSDPLSAGESLTGQFLEGFVVEDAPGFEEWAEEQRRHYRSMATSLLVAAGESALAANRFADAQDAARRALTLEASSESAASLVMRAEALTGDATAALQAYHDYTERLQQDIGEEPSRELEALAERIRSNHWRSSSSRHAELAPPLVGRAETYRTAFELMDDGVRSGARCLLVTGDVGMGKTRLLNECARGWSMLLVPPGPSRTRCRCWRPSYPSWPSGWSRRSRAMRRTWLPRSAPCCARWLTNNRWQSPLTTRTLPTARASAR